MSKGKETKSYEVRLVPGFGVDTGATQHRRAGIVLTTGPDFQTVELDADQLKLVKADPSFEFKGSKSEPAKEESHSDEDDEQTGLSLKSKLSDLKSAAKDLGVEDADKLRSKQEVLDAIEAKKVADEANAITDPAQEEPATGEIVTPPVNEGNETERPVEDAEGSESENGQKNTERQYQD